jgi:hypothetical protein
MVKRNSICHPFAQTTVSEMNVNELTCCNQNNEDANYNPNYLWII